jgi:hypothetical protein
VTRRALAVVLALAAILATVKVAEPASSDASFTARTSNTATASVDSPLNYLRIYSQSTDPDGLTGYAKRQGTSSTPAATGVNASVAAHLGGYNNTSSGSASRVLTIEARDNLPDGVGLIGVYATFGSDHSTGASPIRSPVWRTPGSSQSQSNNGYTVLGPGTKRQLDVSINTSGLSGNKTYTQTLTLTIQYWGYFGDFLTYELPIKVYDGNGAG